MKYLPLHYPSDSVPADSHHQPNPTPGNRGMELSELQKFAGELLAVDDRSGVVYSIENGIVVPRYILVDGNGHSKKVNVLLGSEEVLENRKNVGIRE